MMIRRSLAAGMIAGVMAINATGMVRGQDYPRKPIRVVTSPTGGGLDFIARTMAQGLSGPMGQQFIIDNRPTRLLPELVAKAPADGYHLLVHGSALWLLPFMAEVSHDPLRDFAPITQIARAPLVVVVHPSLPVKSVRDLLALAKARPGDLNYGSGSTGSSSHLSAELLKHMASVNIMRIPYKGLGAATNDLIGGRVHMMFATAPTAAAHVASGRLRALAITSARPSALAPGLPTVAASGLPGYEAATIYGLFAPARTPKTIIDRLNQETVRVVHTADVSKRFFNAGSEVVGSSPAEFAAVIKADMAKMGRMIKDAGIREE
ncbi:MAG: tripartite tricarboxylate transporter substrate binding protein [Betaproteobacteria bacterium]|nr:tripartite tricarboxylate transporter substrate binding protein [Betaproteobacteria bacterium]